jgi:predicted NAD/FAD-dependent oxidoreductase
MAAAEMVGRLLERYALSMEEIDVREQRCVQLEVPIGGKQRRPIDGCVTAIARFCDCKVWVSRDTMMPSYVFFGFESDTALASYLYSLINHAMRTELEVFRAAHPQLRATRLRDASKSFQQGWRYASPIALITCTRRVTPMLQHNARPAPPSC